MTPLIIYYLSNALSSYSIAYSTQNKTDLETAIYRRNSIRANCSKLLVHKIWNTLDKNNSTADAVQVKANLLEQLYDQLQFRQVRATQTLAYGKLQLIAFMTFELSLVTLEWAFAAVGKRTWLWSYYEYSSSHTRHICMGVRQCGKVWFELVWEFDLKIEK